QPRRSAGALRRPRAPPAVSYTRALHDALPISLKATTSAESRFAAISKEVRVRVEFSKKRLQTVFPRRVGTFLTLRVKMVFMEPADRKSTRLNSSHVRMSYPGCCLKQNNDAPRP